GNTTLSNNGTFVLAGTDSSTSTVTINGGTLTLSGSNGALSAVSGITVNTGGTLTLDNTAANNTNRINDAANVSLGGCTLIHLGRGAAASTEPVAALTRAAGNSTLNVTSGSGQSATLPFASLARSAGATVNFTAGAGQTLGSASNKIVFTSAPAL